MNSLYIWKQNEDMVLWIILEYVTVDSFEHFKRYNMPFAILKQKKGKETGNRCIYELWFSEVQLSWRDSPMFLHIIDSHSRPDDHEYQYDHQYDAALRLKDVALCRVLIQFQSFYHGLRSRCILQNGSYEYSFHQLHLPSKFYSGTEWF